LGDGGTSAACNVMLD